MHRLATRSGGSRPGPADLLVGSAASSLISAVTSPSKDGGGGGPSRAPPARRPPAAPVQRGGDMAPEPGRVVVARVQRQPGHRPAAAPGPVGQQGRLAEPGRGADQRQLPLHPLGRAAPAAAAGLQAGRGRGTCSLVASSASRSGRGGGVDGPGSAIGDPSAPAGSRRCPGARRGACPAPRRPSPGTHAQAVEVSTRGEQARGANARRPAGAHVPVPFPLSGDATGPAGGLASRSGRWRRAPSGVPPAGRPPGGEDVAGKGRHPRRGALARGALAVTARSQPSIKRKVRSVRCNVQSARSSTGWPSGSCGSVW